MKRSLLSFLRRLGRGFFRGWLRVTGATPHKGDSVEGGEPVIRATEYPSCGKNGGDIHVEVSGVGSSTGDEPGVGSSHLDVIGATGTTTVAADADVGPGPREGVREIEENEASLGLEKVEGDRGQSSSVEKQPSRASAAEQYEDAWAEAIVGATASEATDSAEECQPADEAEGTDWTGAPSGLPGEGSAPDEGLTVRGIATPREGDGPHQGMSVLASSEQEESGSEEFSAGARVSTARVNSTVPRESDQSVETKLTHNNAGEPIEGARQAVRSSVEAERGVGAQGGRQRRPDREGRPAEWYEQPFGGSDVHTPSDEYAVWNRAVVQHCLLSYAQEAEEVFLTITPRVLATAFAEDGGTSLVPDEAEARFSEVVSAMYRANVLSDPSRLQVLRRCGRDGLPDCASFLALSVLAAYRMRTDEESNASSYYARLEELLRCGFSGPLPRGFDTHEFEGLWLFLRAWLRREHGRELAMPRADASARRYVALPLSHVPLRQVDIDRLPVFFEWAGYEPAESVSVDRIDRDLWKWAKVGGALTISGMEALADERRPAALAEISHEVASWDGSRADAQGRRSASVEIFLEWERRSPVLSYLPRRPAGFPTIFDDGARVFDAGQDGWYEPINMGTYDGGNLREGFQWEGRSDGSLVVLRRRGTTVIAMGPSEFAGPVSRNGLVFGATGSALCCDAVLEAALQYVESVTKKKPLLLKAANNPSGWKLITGIKPVRSEEPPSGLEALEVIAEVEVIPQGGLRLGRRWAWLAEAPPKLFAVGLLNGEGVTIDGDQVGVDEDGAIRDEARLNRPGTHVVEVGRLRRRVEIVRPEIAAEFHRTVMPNGGANLRTLALPSGWWTVIGASPGEVVRAGNPQRAQGLLVNCKFDPVWAISFGSGAGALVLCLSRQPSVPDLPKGRRRAESESIRAWADAIYNANIRRPFVSGFEAGGSAKALQVWATYAKAAREIKRKLRARSK